MRARLLLIAAVAVSMLGVSFGGCFGGPACDGHYGQRALAREDPGITRISVHSAEAAWDFTDPSAYQKNQVIIAAGKANLSQVWNISGDQWTQLAGLSGGNEREDFSAAWDDVNNQMIIHGGYYYTLGMQDASWFQPLYTFNPATNAWTNRGASKLPAGNVGVWDRADQCFITHGGYYLFLDWNVPNPPVAGYACYNETHAWYPGTGTWSQFSAGPARYHHSAVWNPSDGVMLVFGGTRTAKSGNVYHTDYFNDLWAFNLTSDNWTKLNPSGGSPGARAEHTAVWDANRSEMLVFGGTDGISSLSDLWAYNYTQNRWTQKISAPSSRTSHAACWNSDQNVMLVFGGSSGGSVSNETYAYDPAAASWVAHTSLPAPGRIACAAVYDTVRKQMLVYGGGDTTGSDEFTETWSFKYGEPVLKYAPGGTMQSPILDLGDDFHRIDRVSWYSEMPPGANVTIRFRAGTGNMNLSGFQAVINGSAPAQQGRYMQWNLSLQPTADRMASPSVSLVKVEYTLNSKPNVAVVQPAQAFKRVPVKLACNATDTDGDALTYNWTRVSGPIMELNATDVPDPSFTPLQSGTYVFAIVVSDGYSSSPPDAVAIMVPNRVPVADAGLDIAGNKNELVTLHGAGTDADGDPLTYEWAQTGGPDANLTQTTKSFLSFLPQKVGNYTFKLVVNDGEQDSEPSSATVSISAMPPEAVLTANASLVYLNNNVDFSAEKSSDPDGNIMRYIFDFGDGTDSGWTNSSTVAHAYSRPGVFNATLKVRDEDGLISDASPAARMTVRNRPPVVKGSVTPLEGNTSTLFRFSVPSGSTFDPDGVIVGYLWDFGDGASAALSATSHTYKKRGEYEITFRVTDEFGESSEVYFTVKVLNRGPAILSSAPSPASYMVLGNEQLFTVTAQDPDGDPMTYLWIVDSSQLSVNGSTLIYKPLTKGDHRMNVTVSDGQLSAFMDWTLTVRDRPGAAGESAGPDMLIAAGVIIIISACAVAAYAIHRRDKRSGQASPPVQFPPSAPYAPPSPSEDIPMALPADAAYPPQYGAGPMEALPVDQASIPQDASPAEAVPAGQNLSPQQTPSPQENWQPVQEPYSKQLWNK
jgi:N-acetylneuraminic acid mutarotase